MRLLEYLYLFLRMAMVVVTFLALVWICEHPTELGTWYAKFQKGQLLEFNTR